MSQNGKGSKPRPYSITLEEYGNKFDSIFKKTKTTKQESTVSNDAEENDKERKDSSVS